MDGVRALGGVAVRSPSEVKFAGENEACACVGDPQDLTVDKEDFRVVFAAELQRWTVEWKWSGEEPPVRLKNGVSEYTVPDEVRKDYEEEIETWIKNGWLLEYDEEEHGPPKGLIPLMAVVQENKGKVRPVLDFREINTFVDTYTADVDVCDEKLREWRQMGANVALLDLQKAYLQIHVDESLWPYQTVEYKGTRYCLSRLGFGLNIAPRVMKTVLEAVVNQDEDVAKAVSSYVDDVLVNEDVMSAENVSKHLRAFGLQCKEPVRPKEGARILGLRVQEEHGNLKWKRDNDVREIDGPVTKRKVFSLCGRLTGHLPVCGWLRPAVSFLKRKANEAADAWDDVIEDSLVNGLIEEIMTQINTDDPARGQWDVKGNEVTVWADASMLALGVVLEIEGEVVEDGCWLRPTDGTHINMAELDAALKGVNMAILWGAKRVRLMTDSRTVYHWITDLLSGKARLKTKAVSEMLIRRRLSTLKMLADEYSLEISVHSVASADNKADKLTRVPERWRDTRAGSGPACIMAGAEGDENEAGLVKEVERVHHAAGHPGVRRTLYFSKRANLRVTKRMARSVVSACQTCRSIDPAPEKWTGGQLSVDIVWERVAVDVTHFQGRLYLTMVDCGPSRFAIWRQLRCESAAYVTGEMSSIFYERGAPSELLADNATVFRSRAFQAFVREWGTRVRYRAAYAPSGNGIVERNHRSVKVIAARKRCGVPEAVYLYNATPRDDSTDAATPVSMVYKYTVRVKAVDPVQPAEEPEPDTCRYSVGDAVWVKSARGRCDDRYNEGVVTGRVSLQTVEVDGVPRHVRHLQPREAHVEQPQSDTADDEGPLLVRLPEENREEMGQGEGQCRRSQRQVRAPMRYGFDQDRGGV
ncbi:uncharacterized protein LOC122368321 [Amphibalanus amphitrite]|uniref:uncharacterized protein LOC122368321 n=1 Tax=Amphibalanus amphitrite TaxID=1232801 RepID=UPI001C906C8C|nr:uncharacterized protein LOC122368321 [Amphibalanus amphitrite]